MAASIGNKVLVVLASVRDGRQGAKVGQLALSHLSKTSLQSELIDPLVIEPPLLKQPLHFMPDQSAAPVWMTEFASKVKSADGFLIVCPEYNATIPPALTNLLDHVPPAAYRHKPVSVASYSMGNGGGSRVQVALKPFLAELGMILLPASVIIPTVQKSGITDEGACDNERINKNFEKMCSELDWYVKAIQTHKVASSGFPN